jgi:hypothetical protein
MCLLNSGKSEPVVILSRLSRAVEGLTWVAIYATEAGVTNVIPCMHAFPDLVALGSSNSTELGDVKMCLNAWILAILSSELE